MTRYDGQRAIVIGGSIGGLTAGLLLRESGFTVHVYEKNQDNLDGRGGGIVVQPDTIRWFEEFSRIDPERVSTATQWVQYLDAGNDLIHREARPYRYTSWSTFYRALLSDFGSDHYHLGRVACGIDQDEESVTVRFVDDTSANAELVVIADGINSMNRRRIDPNARPEYAGYVGWRGTVHESELSEETARILGDSITYSVGPRTHINIYPIPGAAGETQRGARLMNYVWYRNVAAGPDFDEFMTDKRGYFGAVSVIPGFVQDRFIREMRGAAVSDLAPAAAEVVNLTAQPYVQAIWDLALSRMSAGRVAVLGDAASAARPHAAAGTAKAAANAWKLYESLGAAADVPDALRLWEPSQLELGQQLVRRTREMGARSQTSQTWNPGDPGLRFGLYGPGH